MGETIKRVTQVGGGVIGAAWTARCLARGLEVRIHDPAPSTEPRLDEILALAWPSMTALGHASGRIPREKVRFCKTLAEALDGTDFVQENAPEREAMKIDLFAEIDRQLPVDVPIVSSSSSFLPTRLQSKCRHPQRVLIGHPFNPVYLMPLLELVAGERTTEPAMAKAEALYRSFGMYTLRLKKEIEGYLANRLQDVVWNEMLRLIEEGYATPEDMDAAMAYGPGLRWAFWGPTQVYHLAGGDGGMTHFIDHFRAKMPMSAALEREMIAGADRMGAGRGVRALEAERDAAIVAVIKALQPAGIGAGSLRAGGA